MNIYKHSCFTNYASRNMGINEQSLCPVFIMFRSLVSVLFLSACVHNVDMKVQYVTKHASNLVSVNECMSLDCVGVFSIVCTHAVCVDRADCVL